MGRGRLIRARPAVPGARRSGECGGGDSGGQPRRGRCGRAWMEPQLSSEYRHSARGRHVTSARSLPTSTLTATKRILCLAALGSPNCISSQSASSSRASSRSTWSMLRSTEGENALAGPGARGQRKSGKTDSLDTTVPSVSPRTLAAKRPRKPRAGDAIAPSVLRPHVLARDRLIDWHTAMDSSRALNSRVSSLPTISIISLRPWLMRSSRRLAQTTGPVSFVSPNTATRATFHRQRAWLQRNPCSQCLLHSTWAPVRRRA